MSREASLAKNTGMLLVGYVCTQCVSFFLLPLYTAVLAAEEYGAADLAAAYTAMLWPIVGMLFEQGLFRLMLDDRDDREGCGRLLSTVALCNVLQIAVFGLIFFPVSRFFSFSSYLYFLFPLVAVRVFQGTVLQFSRGIGRTDIYAVSNFIGALIEITLNIVFVAVLRLGLNGLLCASLIAGIGNTLYAAVRLELWRYFGYRRFSLRTLRTVAKYSLPLVPNYTAGWIINTSDRAVISFFLGIGANGVYAVANKFSNAYSALFGYCNLAWIESVSLSIRDPDKDAYINRMLNLFFNLISASCVVILAAMPFLFPLLISSAYQDAYNQIPILMTAVFFQSVQMLFSAFYFALKKTGDAFKTAILSAGINLAVHIVLIGRIGLYAASFSTLAAFLVMTVYRFFDIRKYVPLTIGRKSILLSVLMFGLSFAAYYIDSMLLRVAVLIIVIPFAILVNKRYLMDGVRMVRKFVTGMGFLGKNSIILALCVALFLLLCLGGKLLGKTEQPEGSKSGVRTDFYPAEAEPEQKCFHFSLDDTIACFRYLTLRHPDSVFEEPVFAWLRELHDRFGAAVTCYVFYEDGDFCLSDVPDCYRDEFEANSNWLRFGFHARNSSVDYTASPIAEDYALATHELERIAGSDSIDHVLRLEKFQCSAENVAALSAMERHPVTGLLTADDSRSSYSLSDEQNAYLYSHDLWEDSEAGIIYISTDLRAERIEHWDEKLRELTTPAWNRQRGIMEVFSHEWALDSKSKQAVAHLCQWASEHDYAFVWIEDFIGMEKGFR